MLRLISSIFGLVVASLVIRSFMSVAGVVGGGTGPFDISSFRKADGSDPDAPEVMKQIDAFRALASYARGVVSPTDRAGFAGRVAPARGPALIWDVASDLPSKAHFYLSAEVRAVDPAGPVTVYLVTRQDRKFHSDYGKGGPFGMPTETMGVKGYRTDSTIAVVALPDRAVLGTFRIEGHSPPFNIFVPAGQTEVDGNWWTPIKDWVEPGVRGPAWEAKKEAAEFRKNNPPTPKGLEGLEPLAETAKAALPKARQLANAPKKAAGKRIIWEFHGDYRHDRLSPDHAHLPADRQAAVHDDDVTVFIQTACDVKPVDGQQGQLRREYTVSVVSLPGPTPVGTYRI